MTLLEKLKAKLARAQEIKAAAESADRELNEAEAAELKTIAAACVDLKAQIEQDKQFDAMDAEFNTPQGRRTGAAPVGKKQGAQAKDEDLEAMGGFESLGDYFKAVKDAADGFIDNRLQNINAAETMTNDGSYGFMVPTAVSDTLYKVFQEDTGDLLSSVTSEVTGATSVMIPKDIANPWDAAGITVYWEGAGNDLKLTSMDATTSKNVVLHPVSVFVKVHEDLLDDSPRLESRLMELTPQKMNWELNEAIRNGNGVGMPLGYRKSKAIITIAKESGQAAKTITADNILKMVECLPDGAIDRARWLINKRLYRQLRLLKDEAGNLLWSKRDQPLVGAAPGLLEDIPVYWDSHAEAVGSAGDIQLIVPSGYWFGRRTAKAQFAKSIHLDFDKATTSFRWRFRIGGAPFLGGPLSDAKGDGKISHFIQLAARA